MTASEHLKLHKFLIQESVLGPKAAYGLQRTNMKTLLRLTTRGWLVNSRQRGTAALVARIFLRILQALHISAPRASDLECLPGTEATFSSKYLIGLVHDPENAGSVLPVLDFVPVDWWARGRILEVLIWNQGS